MKIEHPQYFGKLLLSKGFRVWFLYMFKAINSNSFIEEDLHKETGLFSKFDDIYNLELLRIVLNLPPRSGKTTLLEYFDAYALACNPRSNSIYTSFSQSLLSDISRGLANILEHPIYKAMYPLTLDHYEDIEARPIDDFWREYLEKENNKKAIYSNKKIVTKAGGITLFASMGSAITGFGAGIRNSDIFSGFLALDDPNKPIDIHSELLRQKSKTYYIETLLSRLNNSKVPIICIQQRLHPDDMSGFLIDKYGFECLKAPLVKDGKCMLPSQYTPERIKELQQNEAMFNSQYQQEPVEDGGNLFKLDWFKFVEDLPEKFDWRFITADIAYKDKEQNDFTVFAYWGVKEIEDKKRLYLIDMQRAKIKALDIERWIIDWIKEKVSWNFRYIWIEDKAHGIYLNQTFRQQGFPIPTEDEIKETLPRDRDKVERANNVIPYIDKIVYNIYINKNIECIEDFKTEILGFPNSKHDDIVDCVIDGIKIGLAEDDIVKFYERVYGR